MGRPTPAPLGRLIVVKAYRKHGNGAKGGGRKGQTGKRGAIYEISEDGSQVEKAIFEEPNFKALSRKLFGTGLVPAHVRINHNGETHY